MKESQNSLPWVVMSCAMLVFEKHSAIRTNITIFICFMGLYYVETQFVVSLLPLNNDSLGQSTFLSSDDEEIYAFGICFHIILIRAIGIAVEGLEMVNQCAIHVVYFDVAFPAVVFEIEGHLTLVWIRNNFKIDCP